MVTRYEWVDIANTTTSSDAIFIQDEADNLTEPDIDGMQTMYARWHTEDEEIEIPITVEKKCKINWKLRLTKRIGNKNG